MKIYIEYLESLVYINKCILIDKKAETIEIVAEYNWSFLCSV